MSKATIGRRGVAGDEQAFLDIWQSSEDDLRRYLTRRLRERDDVEDVLQETVLAVWKGRSRLTDVRKPSAWLMQIAKNKLTDHHRRAHVRREITGCVDFLGERLLKEPEFDTSAFDAEELSDGLRCLQPVEVTLFFLRYVWGYTVCELAEIFNVPEGTMKFSLYRWRLHVKRRMVAARNQRGSTDAKAQRPILLDKQGEMHQAPPPPILDELTINYPIPRKDEVRIRSVKYKRGLFADIYYPPDHRAGARRPAALFALCYPDKEITRWLGGPLKDCDPYVSWCQAIASVGVIAVTYNQEGRDDIVDLLTFLKREQEVLDIDAKRLGLYACSGCAQYGLYALTADQASTHPGIRFLIFYYPVFAPNEVTPELGGDIQSVKILVAKAGLEQPNLAARVDRFVEHLRNVGCDVETLVHPEGAHCFDVYNRDRYSREIIEYTLVALQRVLGASPKG